MKKSKQSSDVANKMQLPMMAGVKSMQQFTIPD